MMTEDQIERRVEHMTDALDRRYMNSAMSEADYTAQLAKIDRWADWERRFARESTDAE
jgi:hypothetical protein